MLAQTGRLPNIDLLYLLVYKYGMANGENELHLLGMMQIETAQDALAETGMSIDGLGMLNAYVQLHRLIVSERDEENRLASFSVRGNGVGVIKDSIIESLVIVARINTSEERTIAASALLDVLSGQSTS